jgi:hypothetical protein
MKELAEVLLLIACNIGASFILLAL